MLDCQTLVQGQHRFYSCFAISLGLKGVPQNGMLTVKITGTAENPKVDWSR